MQRKVYNTAITALYNFFGLDFGGTSSIVGNDGITVYNRNIYGDIMEPLCENCTVLNLFGASK